MRTYRHSQSPNPRVGLIVKARPQGPAVLWAADSGRLFELIPYGAHARGRGALPG